MEEYRSLILELINKFKKENPPNESELIEAFEEYLNTILEDLLNTESEILDKNKESIKSYLIAIAESFDEMDLEEKKRELIIDDKFEEIRKISTDAFKLAKKILLGQEKRTNVKTDDEKEKLRSLLNDVKKYNKKQAIEMVSEGLLDLDFIESRNVKMISIRLSHIISTMNNKNDNDINR